MAARPPRTLQRPAWADRRTSRGRSRNGRGKGPPPKRLVRQHLTPHVPDERRGIAAPQTHARDRAAWDARCSPRSKSARVRGEGATCANELTSCGVNHNALSGELATASPSERRTG